MRKLFLVCILVNSLYVAFAQTNVSDFQPFSAQGDNLMHITTADFDGVGAKDYVVAMTVDGKVIAFERPDKITDPSADNRLWEYSTLPSMGIRIFAGDVIDNSTGDEVILPGTDGHLRILSSTGNLLMDKTVSTGALYTADIAKGSNGQTIIATAGVDGYIYFLNTMGVQLAKVAPKTEKANGVAGVIRHVVAGDFNGDGADELISFVNYKSFEGNCFFEITDLSTFTRPAYWDGVTSANEDDTTPALGFTDKQLPHAYDMDGDGNDEVVGHWGVFHPEDGPRTQLFSTMLAENEKLPLSKYEQYAQNYLIQNHGFKKSDKETLTSTGKYLLQHGVPGDFDNDGKAELFTVYGDDLFLSDYDTTQKALSISTYTWAHSMYHFSDAACLQDRNGGADKIVLTGPVNGDDHFYLVNLSGTKWRTDARNIYCSGTFAEVESNLDQLTDGVSQFSGTVAEGNEPIWYLDYFASYLGWSMTPENIATHAQTVYDSQQEWYDKIGGQTNYRSLRIRCAASINSSVYGNSAQCKDPDITAQGMVDYCRALAEKGAYFCLKIGHGNNIYMSPGNLADCYEASVANGECYMMARTRELANSEYFDLYKPHLDAVIARAEEIGEEPPMVMLCAKGAIFSTMPQEQGGEYFPKYKDVLVPGVENSNVNVLEWSLAERVGLWMNGDVKRWGCNVIGDNLTANRVAEWGGMRNAHVVLRQMLSQYALGARVFRITSVTNLDNPMYLRGDVTGEDQKWSQPFQKGVLNFLKIVEKGIYPHSPETEQIKGISPVSISLYNRSERLKEQSLKHDHYRYIAEKDTFVFNRMACWNAYTDIPETDITSFLYGTKRRWDNLIPSTPGGFVTIVPHKQASYIESNGWCNQAYQTNGDAWASYTLIKAKDVISNEVMTQRDNLDFHIEGECFWQVTQQKDDPLTYYVLLMGNNVLSPVESTVKLKAGHGIDGECQVFDQLSSTANEAIGVISSPADEVAITIPAGTPRILCVKLNGLPNSIDKLAKEIDNTISVYPNPVSDILNIELKEGTGTDIPITIYDIMGKAVKHMVIKSKRETIDVSNWIPGIYILQTRRKSKNETIKIIVN
jgi:hypothetical protein